MLDEILAKIEEWDGMTGESYEDWMGELDFPIHPDELLDVGMADLIPLMNIKGKMSTTGSCMHQLGVTFVVLDEEWFRSIAMPRILKINDERFIMSLTANYWGASNSNPLQYTDTTYHWSIDLAFNDWWHFAKKNALAWYKGVYLAFEEIRRMEVHEKELTTQVKSRRSVMQERGIEDVDKEVALIEVEDAER